MSVRTEPVVEETDRFDLKYQPWYNKGQQWTQLTLLPVFEVSWAEDAPCGHNYCGWEYYNKQFLSLNQAEELKSALMHDYEPEDEDYEDY